MSIASLSKTEIAALQRRRLAGEAGLESELAWLDVVDRGGSGNARSTSRLRVVAFNAERGTHFDGIVRLLREDSRLSGADVLLLGEVDWGMARSGNRHVARDLAAQLGMSYAFGTEFLELTKGDAREAAVPGENTQSLHGNAILSRFDLHAPRIVRLPVRCAWDQPEQARIGGRMALLAEIDAGSRPITLASAHLENRTTPRGRREQMAALIAAIPENSAAIVAGDLNTSTIDPDDHAQLFSIPDLLAENPQRLVSPQVYEPLFGDMRAAGFLIDEVNELNVPTSVPLGIEDPKFWMKLDWIFVRGLRPLSAPHVVPAREHDKRLSDHDFVVVDVA